MRDEDWVKTFLSTDVEARKHIKLDHKTMKGLHNNPSYVLGYIRRHHIHMKKAMRARCKNDPAAPPYRKIIKLFGGWKEVVKAANFKKMDDKSDDEILSLLVSGHVFTVKRLEKLHHLEPGVFPSRRYVEKRFGSWGNCKNAVCALSPKCILEHYMNIRFKTKKWPTEKKCAENGLIMEELYKTISPKDVKSFVEVVERKFLDEKRTRDQLKAKGTLQKAAWRAAKKASCENAVELPSQPCGGIQ